MDFISQLLDGMVSQQAPSQIAFINGQPIINPKYNGPLVQKPQYTPPPALQSKIDDILGMFQYQDQWMGRMRLPLQSAAERRRSSP